ncbi:MAG: phosphoenolpyruvate--protein phosphotransferase [Lachnospiraceae bacterium]|nr:phosphoenolpyruvate--protein phosphotransferase [Lachnospiraceae bacterium]
MNKFFGKTVFPGISYGEIAVIKNIEGIIRRIPVYDPEIEIRRFLTALDMTKLHLENLYLRTVSEFGLKNAEIFDAQQMILNDCEFQVSIINIIREQSVNAEYAIAVTRANFTKIFADMDDEYIKERVADLTDLSKRLVRILQNVAEENRELPEKCVIVADDLAPSEIIRLNKKNVVAVILRYGSLNSHAAILARAMNIPVIINVPLPENITGQMIIVNSQAGYVILNPSEDEFKNARQLIAAGVKNSKKLREMHGLSSETKSGRKIRLAANIGGLNDLEAALENDAEAIGLFRSEFLYMEKNDYPTEDEQFQVYKQAAETMAGKEVVIRTLDIGADKQISYFDQTSEANPALGIRGIRFSLCRENIFRTQLRAIYRASAYGKINLLIPMIISLEEVKKVKKIIADIKNELTNEGKVFGTPLLGIMIETPAAVLIADELAKEAGFFSIGTNDLTQYTLAIDCQNTGLDIFYNPHHPAIFEMIKLTVKAAKRAGIRVSICGEMAANPDFTDKFAQIGVDELSVLPSLIFPLRKKIRELE